MRFLQKAVELDSNRAEYRLYVGWAANEIGQHRARRARAQAARSSSTRARRRLLAARRPPSKAGAEQSTRSPTLQTALEKRPVALRGLRDDGALLSGPAQVAGGRAGVAQGDRRQRRRARVALPARQDPRGARQPRRRVARAREGGRGRHRRQGPARLGSSTRTCSSPRRSAGATAPRRSRTTNVS